MLFQVMGLLRVCRIHGRSTLPAPSKPPEKPPTNTVGVVKLSWGSRRGAKRAGVRVQAGHAVESCGVTRQGEAGASAEFEPLRTSHLASASSRSTSDHGIISRSSSFLA